MCLMQDFYLQIMDKEEGDSGKFGFDPLDCTKVTNLLCENQAPLFGRHRALSHFGSATHMHSMLLASCFNPFEQQFEPGMAFSACDFAELA